MKIACYPTAMAVLILCISLLVPLASVASPRADLEKKGIAFTADGFIKSAAKGDLEAVKLFLAAGMRPDARNQKGETALEAAAAGGHTDLAHALIEAGARVDATNPYISTPLKTAAYYGHTELVKLLVEHGALVGNVDGVTALGMAAFEGHREIVNFLLNRGVAVNSRGDYDAHILHSAMGFTQRELERVVKKSGKYGAGNTALILAAYNGKTDIVKLLVGRGAEVNAKGVGGETALMRAAKEGHREVVKFLLDHGADPDIEDGKGRPALAFALNPLAGSNKTHEGVVQLLVDGGANDKRKTLEKRGLSYNANSFTEQAGKGNLEAVRMFLAAWMSPNARNQKGETALMAAARGGHTDLAHALIEAGAWVHATNPYQNTPLITAAYYGHTDFARLLLENNVKPNAANKAGDTALHWAAANGYAETARLLLDKGADASVKNKKGQTALDLAKQKRHTGVVKLLQEEDWSWLLAYKGKSTNSLLRDKAFRALMRREIPEFKAYFGMTRNKKKGKLIDVLGYVLGGPPDLVRIPIDRTLVLSACRYHSCDEKGFLWIDTQKRKSVFAIVHYLYGKGKLGAQLFFGSKNSACARIPRASKKEIKIWLNANKISKLKKVRCIEHGSVIVSSL